MAKASSRDETRPKTTLSRKTAVKRLRRALARRDLILQINRPASITYREHGPFVVMDEHLSLVCVSHALSDLASSYGALGSNEIIEGDAA